MKAKCIDDKSEEYPNFKGKSSQNKVTGLTKDKSYEVEQSKQYDDYFEVINDLGVKESYKKERFEVMECINKDCNSNIDNKCVNKVINNTCVECDKRIKPQHTLNYAEEQLEYAKEKEAKAYSLCYNKECQHFRKDNKCDLSMAIKCASYLAVPINYEEEYKKLKEENEDFKERLDNQAESIESYMKENEKYRDYIKDSNKVFDKLTKENEKLENTRDALVEANNKLKKEKELIESQLENEFGRNGILKEKFDTLDSTSCQLFVENGDLTKEINQLRDDVQKANFKLKEYESKLPQLKELVVKLIRINEILASNIYVEGLED